MATDEKRPEGYPVLEDYTPSRFMLPTSHYDRAKADRAVKFVQNLRHTKGQWAGKRFWLLPWQEQIIRDLFGIVKEDGNRQFLTAYVEISKKNGKSVALDTKIPTPDGFITMGDIRVGDTVFDEKGRQCHVVRKSIPDDTEQAYRLTFRDGSEILASDSHLWDCEPVSQDAGKVIWTSREIYQHQEAIRRNGGEPAPVMRIPRAGPLQGCRYGYPAVTGGGGHHYLESIAPVEGRVMTQCIQVDSSSHCYLVGESFIPTHNSELAAAIALYLLYADGEPSAEVYGAAVDRDQASMVFDVAKGMVQMTPALMRRSKIMSAGRRIVNYENSGFYRVLSAEVGAKHGLNVSGLIFDELHAQPNRELYDVLTKGSGDARRQPLFFLITTAGNDKNSICYSVHTKAEDILDGRRKDPTFYPVIYGLKEGDDWHDPENWKKANPSLGYTIGMEGMRKAHEDALENPAEENTFRQLRLNTWVGSEVAWIPDDVFAKGNGPIDLDALRGRKCFAGLDLSTTTDITAFVMVFPPDDEKGEYIVVPHFWIPEETLKTRVRRDHVPYDEWAGRGLVHLTEGNTVDYAAMRRKIVELGQEYRIQEIAADDWNATETLQMLEWEGFTVLTFGQGYRSMSPAMKRTYQLFLEGRLRHGGNPVLRWMAGNVVAQMDAAENIKPNKEKSRERIDGIVALIMAVDRCVRHEEAEEPQGSVYDDPGHDLIVF